jgi:hypothetical protein
MSRRAWRLGRDVPSAKQLTALANSFDWDSYTTKLQKAIQPHYEAIASEQGQRTADQYDIDWDADAPFVDRFFTAYVSERITQIDESTRDMVRDLLQSTLEAHESESKQELAGRIRELDPYAFSPARALTIARTETSTAIGHGAGLAYQQNGIEHVEISDGDDDDDCAEADGQIWTVDEYLAEPLAHPNCVRSAAPVLESDDESDDEG